MDNYGQENPNVPYQNGQTMNMGYAPNQNGMGYQPNQNPNMGYQPYSNMGFGNQLTIDNYGFQHLNSIMSKIKFMSIFGLIVLSLYVLVLLLGIFGITQSHYIKDEMILGVLIGILIIGLFIFIIAKMLSGANKIKKAINTQNQGEFNNGLGDINTSITIQYVLTVIYIILIVIGLFIGLLTSINRF